MARLIVRAHPVLGCEQHVLVVADGNVCHLRLQQGAKTLGRVYGPVALQLEHVSDVLGLPEYDLLLVRTVGDKRQDMDLIF